MLPAIPACSPDTDADAEQVQIALLRAVSVARRLNMAFQLSATVIGMARRGLARTRPQASARELNLRFVELHYGAETAELLRTDIERREAARSPRA